MTPDRDVPEGPRGGPFTRGALVRLGLSFLAATPLVAQDRVVPRAGLVITKSVRLVPGEYRLAAPRSLDDAAITIRGDAVTVDARGVTLVGSPDSTAPDAYAGVAIRIDGGHGVTILGARIHGYRFGVLAKGTRALVLDGLDVSRTWKPRLFSLIEHESLVDWLSFHHNDHDEWLRYGAGIYLESVDSGDVTNVTGEQGMNGLMLARTDHLRIWDNDFSFNSGLGIGLYRSSDNNIQHNRLDYDVRGYSHKFYHRGQDSAGLLLFEQSSRNIIAWNSVTHGGDGLFLWAGQSTMDSGTGGCNDNLIYGNDFSFAPANGIEVTFSRNIIAGNRIQGNDYGIWGGYSFDTKIVGNTSWRNRTGVAIEHGQDNRIGRNVLRDSVAINLWGDSLTPSDWGYPKHRDVRSRGYLIDSNFVMGQVGVRARRTDSLTIAGNVWFTQATFDLRDTQAVRILPDSQEQRRFLTDPLLAARVPGDYARLAPSPLGRDTIRPHSDLAGRERDAILVDDWGPYDYRALRLWPVDSSRAGPQRLVLLGPDRRVQVTSQRGSERLTRKLWRTGDTVLVTPRPDSTGDWEITFDVIGERGKRVVYSHFEPTIAWNAKFFVWSDSADPRAKPDQFETLLQGTPLLTRTESRLDYEWYGPAIKPLPLERWALEAEGTVDLGPGTYSIRTISDDAIRVWVDGRLAIDDWTPHESVVDHAVITGGHHSLKVQYYQVDGWTELRLEIVRGVETSTGSPGPH